jgi:hypothetical protein
MYKVIITSLFIGSLWSCQKEEKNDKNSSSPQKSERFRILTSHVWQMKDIRIGTQSFWNFIPECNRDDRRLFRPERDSMMLDNGPEKCKPEHPQTSYYSWKFFANESGVIFIKDSVTRDTYDVVELTSAKLRLGKPSADGLVEFYYDALP